MTLSSLTPFKGIKHVVVWQKLNYPISSKRNEVFLWIRAHLPSLHSKAAKSACHFTQFPDTHVTLTDTLSTTFTLTCTFTHSNPCHELKELLGALVPFCSFVLLSFICFCLFVFVCVWNQSLGLNWTCVYVIFHVINNSVEGAYKNFVLSPVHACFSQLINTMLTYIDQS